MNNAMKYVQVRRAIKPSLNLQLHILFLSFQTQLKQIRTEVPQYLSLKFHYS